MSQLILKFNPSFDKLGDINCVVLYNYSFYQCPPLEVTRKYNEQSNSIEDKEADKVERLEQLTKEKDELLALVMQRGKTIEVSFLFFGLF